MSKGRAAGKPGARSWLLAVWAGLIALASSAACGGAGYADVAIPGLEALDQTIVALMEEFQVPGGSMALVKDGRLVVARGYGQACAGGEEVVQPDSLFRIASVSKPLTAVAILRLVEAGRLDLEDRAFVILDHLLPPEGETMDPRLGEITVRHLLEHSAGWDRNRSFDPMYSYRGYDHLPKDQWPASCEDIIRGMLGRRLDFAPGTEHAYSNLGYCVLSEIVEAVTGQSYETYVQREVLAPLGVARMRIGGSLLEERAEGEVCYHDYAGALPGRSAFPDLPEFVPQPYGSMVLEATAANGGWIASAVDLVRFLLAVDGEPSPPDILRPETIRQMVERPALPDWQDPEADYYYALGWEVSTDGEHTIWSHDGAMPGTRSLLARRSDGYALALLFNSDPRRGGEFVKQVVDTIVAFVAETAEWPPNDLFAQYSAERP